VAQLYATGPVDVWVGAGGGPLFLGHGERAPRIQVQRMYKPAHTDLAGDVPHDKAFAGEWALVTLALSRYNESTLALIQDVAGANLVGTPPTRGFNVPGERGSLMLAEGQAYPLYLRFPFAAKPVYQSAASGAMPAGYRFPAAYLGGPDDLFDLGLPNARKVGLVFECVAPFDPTVTNAYGAGAFKLYDHNLSALPAAFN
jgi:hypothetical protein